ncbi:MAG: DUF4276 family protein [Planctomycetota bacterium]
MDRDSDDCRLLKSRLEDISRRAGLRTRSRGRENSWQVVNRIVVEELEAWYFGDWDVRQAFPRVAKNVPRRARFRESDAILKAGPGKPSSR